LPAPQSGKPQTEKWRSRRGTLVDVQITLYLEETP